MTRKELESLKIGTLLYNGHTEGVIKAHDGIKYIEILIPIQDMSNSSNHIDDRPEYWDVLEF